MARAQWEPKADAVRLELHAPMKKPGSVGDTDGWRRQRALHNAVGHEYPDPDAIADILIRIHAAAPGILAIVEHLQATTEGLPGRG